MKVDEKYQVLIGIPEILNEYASLKKLTVVCESELRLFSDGDKSDEWWPNDP